MKKLLLFMLCFTFVSAGFGQVKINLDSCFNFVQSSFNNLNIQLYNGILEGKIPSYTNDSLATKMSLLEWVEIQTKTVAIQNALKKNDTFIGVDTIKVVRFNPKTNFTGSTMIYHRFVNPNTFSFTYKLRSYAGTYNFVEQGYSIGSRPYFNVAEKDLFSTLRREDVSFYNCLLNQQIIHAEFSKPKDTKDLEMEALANNGISITVLGGHHVQINQQIADSFIAWYNFQLFTAIARKHWKEGGRLYKDVKLKKRYDRGMNDLNMDFVVQISNPDHPDDPYDFIDTLVTIPFAFADHYNLQITPRKDDYIIGLMIPDIDDTLLGRIYYSFNELGKYALPSDRVVMRRLLMDATVIK